MYRRPRGGRGGRSRGRGGASRGGGRGRRPNTEDTTANQLPQRHESFPSESTPQNAGFGSNSPRNNLFPGEYTVPNVGFSHSPPQQESFPSDPALGYGRDPPQRDIFPSDSNVSFGGNPPQHEPFPSDSVPSDAGFGRKLPPHDHFARDSTPPNVGFCHSPPWHGSIPNDPTSGNSPRHDSFIVDTTPLNIDFGAHSSDPSTAYPPAAQFRRERATPKQTTWQDFEKEELSKGVSLGKHKQMPSPGSEKGGSDDKQLRLDAEVQSQEQEGLAGSTGTGTSTQGENSREKDGDLGVEGSKDGDPGGKKSKVKKGSDVQKPPQLSVEDLAAVNKKVLMVEGTITHDQYFCSLCHAQLNCKRSLEKHMHSTEHIRRIVNLNNTKVFPYFCEVCVAVGVPTRRYTNNIFRGRNTSGTCPYPVGVREIVCLCGHWVTCLMSSLRRKWRKKEMGCHWACPPT